MRWSGAGLDAVIALCTVHCSEQWDAFWASAPLRNDERRHPHLHLRPLRARVEKPVPLPTTPHQSTPLRLPLASQHKLPPEPHGRPHGDNP